jgi:ribonuclease M5
MSVKPKIKGVVIVEGKTDSNKLQSLFDVRTIETNGTHLSTKTIELIKQTAKQHRIILFLDPDGPGEAIRRKLNKYLDSYDQAFIKKTDIASKKKIGVAEAYDRAIIKAFKDTLSYDKNQSSLT